MAVETTQAEVQQRIERDAAWLFAWFRRNDFMVLFDHEVEAEGVHIYFEIPHKTLAGWRTELTGPPSRTRRRVAWYQIRALVEWIAGQRAAGRTYRDIGVEPDKDPLKK